MSETNLINIYLWLFFFPNRLVITSIDFFFFCGIFRPTVIVHRMTAAFPPDVRHCNLERLVVEVVRSAIDREGKRLLLIIEDAQWMNQLSMKLLLKARIILPVVVQRSSPSLLVSSCRAWGGIANGRLSRLENCFHNKSVYLLFLVAGVPTNS